MLKISSEGAQPGAVLVLAGCVCSALVVTSPSPLTDGKVRKPWVGHEFLITLKGVCDCGTLLSKTGAGDAFYNQIWHLIINQENGFF